MPFYYSVLLISFNDITDARLTGENYRSCRDRQKISYDEDSCDSEITDIELTPVKTPIRLVYDWCKFKKNCRINLFIQPSKIEMGEKKEEYASFK
jgi:hypothetical protein